METIQAKVQFDPQMNACPQDKSVSCPFEPGRLERIEMKLDKVFDTVVDVARVQEKLESLHTDHLALTKKVIDDESTLADVSEKVVSSSNTIDTIRKVFWIGTVAVITAVVSIIVTNYWPTKAHGAVDPTPHYAPATPGKTQTQELAAGIASDISQDLIEGKQ